MGIVKMVTPIPTRTRSSGVYLVLPYSSFSLTLAAGSINTTMPHTTYIVRNYSQLDPMFLWAQHYRVPMYKTRITKGNIQWVIELPSNSLESLFLLQYSNSVRGIANLR